MKDCAYLLVTSSTSRLSWGQSARSKLFLGQSVRKEEKKHFTPNSHSSINNVGADSLIFTLT